MSNGTKSAAEWLEYQQRVHPRSIALGLERVREVWLRMGAPPAAPIVVTVAGTNGKGSTVAFLEAMLAAAGKRVGCYTSPHLLRYNERVRVAGSDVDDAALVDAFERIEAARMRDSAVALTYFEYGTLAALWIFSQSALDVALLEVGLGGRLDAVNIVDPDVAVVTTVDLDHQDWLGDNRDSIGREKAGICRSGRPAVIGAADPPDGLLREAMRIGARLLRAGRDFSAAAGADGWIYRCGDVSLALPLPALAAPVQVDNAAAAVAALQCLRDRLGWNPPALASGIAHARLAARLQRFAQPGCAEIIVDVAHNPQAARSLAQWLSREPAVRTWAVFGALEDKDPAGIVAALVAGVDGWHLAGLDRLTPRGLSAQRLRDRLGPLLERTTCGLFADPRIALEVAVRNAAANERIVAFGSFHVAASALEMFQQRQPLPAISGDGRGAQV